MRKSTASLTILSLLASACTAITPRPLLTADPNKPVGDTSGTAVPATPDDTGLLTGPGFISEADILILESFPVQIMLHITGELPTPCHQFRARISGPDDRNRIVVEAYSVYPSDQACIQVLEPFDENVPIPMAGAPDGDYTVWLNGEQVGEFSYPGG